jgi:hypothetical protein
MRRCSRCGISYPATTEYFHRNSHGKYGLQQMCKRCRLEWQREHKESINARGRRWRAENREEYNKSARERRQSRSEIVNKLRRKRYQIKVDHKREMNRRYYAEHREKLRELAREKNSTPEAKKERSQKNKEWRAKNISIIKEKQRQWAINNPEKIRENWHRRRARKKNAEGRYTPEDIKKLYEAQKGKCYWCGAKVGVSYHIDHVIPLARGGDNYPSNIVISCPHCNESRKDKLPHEWGDKLL